MFAFILFLSVAIVLGGFLVNAVSDDSELAADAAIDAQRLEGHRVALEVAKAAEAAEGMRWGTGMARDAYVGVRFAS